MDARLGSEDDVGLDAHISHIFPCDPSTHRGVGEAGRVGKREAWTMEDEGLLVKGVIERGEDKWQQISDAYFAGRRSAQAVCDHWRKTPRLKLLLPQAGPGAGGAGMEEGDEEEQMGGSGGGGGKEGAKRKGESTEGRKKKSKQRKQQQPAASSAASASVGEAEGEEGDEGT